MTFANPTILWALFFGLTPVIIYYLMRYRSIREPWGANYVLERALDRLRNRWYLDQLILIMLRVLACLLLVFAFARPLSESDGRITGTGRHHVIVADGSYSMLASDEDGSQWDRSKETMKKLVASWGRGEKWSLLLLGHGTDEEGERGGEWIVREDRITSQENTKERIDNLEPGQHTTSIREAMQKVQSEYGNENLDVFLFSGDQATAWKGFEDLTGQLDRGILQDSSGHAAPLLWFNPPLDDRENVAVTGVQPASEVTLVDQPTRVFVEVENFGNKPKQDIKVSLQEDGSTVKSETTSLLPGQSRWVHFDYTPDATGSSILTARVGEDVLDFDNEMSAGVERRDNVSVLVLSDDAEPAKFESSWGFLDVMARMLKSLDSKDGADGSVELALSSEDNVESRLPGYDVVLLDGSTTVTPELARQLRSWGTHGGIILTADEQVDQERWNRHLGKEGLLPATLKGIQTESLGEDTYRSLARADLNNSPFRFFESEDYGDVSQARIYLWHTLNDLTENSSEWMSYDNGDAFIIGKEMDDGPGRVILLTSGLSGRNSNLVVRKFYLPLLYQLFRSAASGTLYPRSVRLNDDIVLDIDDQDDIRGVTYNQEGKDAISLSPRERDGRMMVRQNNASRSGPVSIQLIREGETSRVWFGVQGPRNDSDLKLMTDKLRASLTQSDKVNEVSEWEELREKMQGTDRGSEWHHWVLIALLLVFVAEMFLERRFV